MKYQKSKSKMIKKNVKAKNYIVKIYSDPGGFVIYVFFSPSLNFKLYFSILIFNFYIYRFWQRICYMDLRLCYLCRIDTCNKGGLV
jgi:hypothetical protein